MGNPADTGSYICRRSSSGSAAALFAQWAEYVLGARAAHQSWDSTGYDEAER